MAKQDEYTRYTIRIPTPLYERVKSAAGEKSVNAQIIEDLEEKYPAPTKEELVENILSAMSALAELYEKDIPPATRRGIMEDVVSTLIPDPNDSQDFDRDEYLDSIDYEKAEFPITSVSVGGLEGKLSASPAEPTPHHTKPKHDSSTD